jgi:hypothetical protein
MGSEVALAVRTRVALVRTRPETVEADYARVLELSGCAELLRRAEHVTAYGNLTWNRFFPSVSSPPWQLSGVAGAMGTSNGALAGWRWLAGRGHTHQPRRGVRANLWEQALRRHGQSVEAVRGDARGVPLPRGRTFFYLDQAIHSRLPLPSGIEGSVALHLPTFKAHGQLGLAGAMENAWGTWLPTGGAPAAVHPHEILVDLLIAQRQVHPAICAVLDGAVLGDGAGPRTVEARPGNVLLASTDPVALDAVAARLAGFDPFSLRYLALAYALGLGNADPDQIDLVGDAVTELDLRLHVRRAPAALTRLLLERLNLTRLEERLFARRRWLALASRTYYDLFWYHTIGRQRLASFWRSAWGRLFASYQSG